jgi:ATP-dependent 26S proteasome regulatory subunit
MNRPQRIDDKIEVGFPSGESRKQLFKFFAKPDQEISEETLSLIASKACEEFTPAHIKEVFIRSAIYDYTLDKTIRLIVAEIAQYKNAFTKKSKLGLGNQSNEYELD